MCVTMSGGTDADDDEIVSEASASLVVMYVCEETPPDQVDARGVLCERTVCGFVLDT